MDFEARILGEGPERKTLNALHRSLGLEERVRFVGHVDQSEVWKTLEWADVLLHMGIVAPSGDRDGLPNVIPEAMAAGTVVVTSPHAATTEAIADGRTGFVRPVAQPEQWVDILIQIAGNDELVDQVREAARQWTEQCFDAHLNAAILHACYMEAAKS